MSITKMEDSLFSRWSLVRPRFIPDGVVDETSYLKSNKKLLYLLKEANGGENWDLRDFLRSGACSATWNNVARWTYGIERLNENVSWFQINSIDESFRKKLLQSICVVNLKKESGGGSTQFTELQRYSEQDRDFILEQLSIYKADVIICCGTQYPVELKWNETTRGIEYARHDKSVIFQFYHPAVRWPSKFLFYSLIDAVREVLSAPDCFLPEHAIE